MVAKPMGMVPKNIETVECPKIRRASSKNITQRAVYNALNSTNRKIVNSHSPSAKACSPGQLNGSCANASASTPVPMVAANQLGVNWRITSRGRAKWLNGLRLGVVLLGQVMVSSSSSYEVEPMIEPYRISI